mmetsp:Transcript_13743/g.52337  ORF Transcript_13743/g.52337 Transcript_13743/m.52337 type:complete len:247 (+) Transcript_13743:216-956(+)
MSTLVTTLGCQHVSEGPGASPPRRIAPSPAKLERERDSGACMEPDGASEGAGPDPTPAAAAAVARWALAPTCPTRPGCCPRYSCMPAVEPTPEGGLLPWLECVVGDRPKDGSCIGPWCDCTVGGPVIDVERGIRDACADSTDCATLTLVPECGPDESAPELSMPARIGRLCSSELDSKLRPATARLSSLSEVRKPLGLWPPVPWGIAAREMLMPGHPPLPLRASPLPRAPPLRFRPRAATMSSLRL